jgi:ABC-type Mn2+/Zn2+ transport system permease subunit
LEQVALVGQVHQLMQLVGHSAVVLATHLLVEVTGLIMVWVMLVVPQTAQVVVEQHIMMILAVLVQRLQELVEEFTVSMVK